MDSLLHTHLDNNNKVIGFDEYSLMMGYNKTRRENNEQITSSHHQSKHGLTTRRKPYQNSDGLRKIMMNGYACRPNLYIYIHYLPIFHSG